MVYAAFYNTALVRYVDYMDSYLVGGGLCHPSDNTAAILSVSEHANLSGKDFLGALALAYQVESRLTAAIPFMADGFDLTTPLSVSLAAGVSKALGLDGKDDCCDRDGWRLHSSARSADHSAFAMEGTVVIAGRPGVRARSPLGVPWRDRSAVCVRGTNPTQYQV